MTLGEISAGFLAFIDRNESHSSEGLSTVHAKSLKLLSDYCSPNAPLSEIIPERLRDFIARWYPERALTSSLTPRELLDSLAKLLDWIDRQARTNFAEQASPILLELRDYLPRALEITAALSSWLRERGGAFGFPEFLTSFEEGGHSEYDIDIPGKVGTLEGYFRIVRVEGTSVEAEEMLTEERVWPILFPGEVSSLLDDRYIINLELVRSPEGWHIEGCGFAYPPGTDLF